MRSAFRRRLHPFVTVASAAVVALTARASLADHYRVPTGSMEPTVHVGDHILVSKVAYGLRVPLSDAYILRFGQPARGDVVVLDPPGGPVEDAPGEVLLKRVVAVGGDVVSVTDGHVAIDGRRVDEPWASLDMGGGPDLPPTRVPPGKVLVLGDNRGNSRDGRYFGFVPLEKIYGRAEAVVAPSPRSLE